MVQHPPGVRTVKSFIAPLLMLTCLAACGERPTAPAEPAAPAAPAATPQAEPTALTIEQACREAVRIEYGQEGSAVSFDDRFNLSWAAPVDGGRLEFACSVVGSQVSLTNGDETRTVDISAPAATPAQGVAH